MICVINVSASYGKIRALNDVSLEIPPGIFGLLGPNGAGKTTLLKILSTLIKPDGGRVTLDSYDWERVADVRKIIGYLPQQFEFFKYLTVTEALDYIACMKNIEDPKGQIGRVLELTGMTPYAGRKIKTLSGGMMRRLGICQAVMGKPKLVILDEPMTGLDPAERFSFRDMIKHVSQFATVIMSTHIVQEIEMLCGDLAILKEGKVMACGAVSDVISGAGATSLEDAYLYYVRR